MHVEDRCLGVLLTPEVRALVRTVFERALLRIEGHIDHVRVRVVPVREGVQCRAVLWPHGGATLAITETRPAAIDAMLASANGLAREFERRYVAQGRKSRRARASQRRRAKLAA